MTLGWIDWLAIAAYVLVIASASLLLSRRPKSSEDYFLAGRTLRWPFIGASLFAANISAEHFVGLAGSGYSGGMAVGGYEWSAVFCLVPLITLFLPFYIKNKIFTVPEFLEQRYGTGIRLFFSGFMVILSVLTKISISLWASSLVFSSLLGWNPYTVIWVVGLGTALYTMKGGLRVVVYTDALQTTVLLFAAIIVTVVGLRHVGGWSGLHAKLAPGDVLHGQARHGSRLSLAGDVLRGLPRGQLLLVHGPGPRAAGVRRQGPERGPKGRDPLRVPEADDPVPARPSGTDRQGDVSRPREAGPGLRRSSPPHHAGGAPRADDQRHRRRAHGPHQRHLQLHLDPGHAGFLPALASRRPPRPSRSAWAGGLSSPSSFSVRPGRP